MTLLRMVSPLLVSCPTTFANQLPKCKGQVEGQGLSNLAGDIPHWCYLPRNHLQRHALLSKVIRAVDASLTFGVATPEIKNFASAIIQRRMRCVVFFGSGLVGETKFFISGVVPEILSAS